jgi:hypothetical protein
MCISKKTFPFEPVSNPRVFIFFVAVFCARAAANILAKTLNVSGGFMGGVKMMAGKEIAAFSLYASGLPM